MGLCTICSVSEPEHYFDVLTSSLMKRAVGEVRNPQKENRRVSSLPGVTAVMVNPVLGLFLLLHLVEKPLSVIHPNKPHGSPPDGPPGWACPVLHGKAGLTGAKSMSFADL